MFLCLSLDDWKEAENLLTTLSPLLHDQLISIMKTADEKMEAFAIRLLNLYMRHCKSVKKKHVLGQQEDHEVCRYFIRAMKHHEEYKPAAMFAQENRDLNCDYQRLTNHFVALEAELASSNTPAVNALTVGGRGRGRGRGGRHGGRTDGRHQGGRHQGDKYRNGGGYQGGYGGRNGGRFGKGGRMHAHGRGGYHGGRGGEPVKCYKCGQYGHVQAGCRNKRPAPDSYNPHSYPNKRVHFDTVHAINAPPALPALTYTPSSKHSPHISEVR